MECFNGHFRSSTFVMVNRFRHMLSLSGLWPVNKIDRKIILNYLVSCHALFKCPLDNWQTKNWTKYANQMSFYFKMFFFSIFWKCLFIFRAFMKAVRFLLNGEWYKTSNLYILLLSFSFCLIPSFYFLSLSFLLSSIPFFSTSVSPIFNYLPLSLSHDYFQQSVVNVKWQKERNKGDTDRK